MPLDPAFAPYRLAPGALPDEGSRGARLVGAGPLVAPPDLPLRPALLGEALASIEVGQAADEAEACRAADGSLAGTPAAPRACLVGERHRQRVEEATRAALAAGYAGVVLHRPDAPLVEGLLGAGFCPDCQREFQRRLSRKYGEQFQPLDFLATARDAVAGASGALSFDHPPLRPRLLALPPRVAGAGRAGPRPRRPRRRAGGRPRLLAVRLVRGARPLAAGGGAPPRRRRLPGGAERPLAWPAASSCCAARSGAAPWRWSSPADAPPAAWLRLASLGAPYGIGLAGVQPGGEVGAMLAGIRALVHEVAARGAAPSASTPLSECAVLYSAEADLWSSGRHRRAVEAAIEVAGRPPAAGDGGAPPLRGARRHAAGAGRRRAPLPDRAARGGEAAGRRRPPAGLHRAGRRGPASRRPIDAQFPVERRAVSLAEPAPVIAAVRASGEAVNVHLATAWPERANRSGCGSRPWPPAGPAGPASA